MNTNLQSALENSKTKVLETIVEDADAVFKYKAQVKKQHAPKRSGDTPL